MSSAVRIAILANAKQATREVDGFTRTTSKLGKLGAAAKGVAKLAGGFVAFAAVGAATKLLAGSVEAARESQKVNAQTAAVLKSTGHAAGVTAKQVGALAGAISRKTGIDDEAIQSGQNLLLTFTNIKNQAGKSNKIFDQSTKLMVDLGAAMGKDPKSGAILLGKALNDPAKGLTALTRVGVSFTDKQKATIKKMSETGNVLGAQKIILKELNKEFGGSAAAQATAADKAKVAWGNLQEQIGGLLLPVIDKVAGVLADKVIPAVSKFISQIQSGKGPGGRFAAVMATIGSVVQRVAGFIGGTLVPFIVKLGKSWLSAAGGTDGLKDALHDVQPAIDVVISIVKTLGRILKVVLPVAAKIAGKGFRALGKAVGAVGEVARFMYNKAFRPVIRGILKAIAVTARSFAKIAAAAGKLPGPMQGTFKRIAKSLRLGADGADKVRKSIGKIPTKKKVKVTADTGGAIHNVLSLIAQLGRVRDKKVKVTTIRQNAPNKPRVTGNGRSALRSFTDTPQFDTYDSGAYLVQEINVTVTVPPTANPAQTGREIAKALAAYRAAGGRLVGVR